MKPIKIIIALCCSITLLISCKKDWLDAKPNKALVVPSTVEDYQAILDNNTINSLFNYNQPGLCEVSAGDYYLLFTTWQGLSLAQDRNAYIWASNIYQGENGSDWNKAYYQILNANIVLEGIEKVAMTLTNEQAWNNVKGSALFYRSYMFYSLAQEFCKPYVQSTASSDLGILLRTTSDVNVKVGRSTVQQTYDQIIGDLILARDLLPQNAAFPSRPSRNSVWALLARTYLSMEKYDKAFLYADSCLQSSNALLDFNLLTTLTPPLTRFNKEVIFYQLLVNYGSFNPNSPRLIIDSSLFQTYDANDLRKTIYFTKINNINTYKGYYANDFALFSGLATDEMFLIRAECYARAGNKDAALTDLNALMITRWKNNGTWIPFSAIDATDALNKILVERRKELVYRGLRWSDLRRLNKDARFAITLTRVLSGQTYTLSPNDIKYVFPLPDAEVALNGIQQNPR